MDAGSTHWDGVRNFQAQKHIRSMHKGDLAFFYHTGKDKHIRGVVRVCSEAYPDHTDETEKSVMVDVETVKPFNTFVSLQTIKEDPHLQHLPLIKQSRLSVVPIDTASWEHICTMGVIEL